MNPPPLSATLEAPDTAPVARPAPRRRTVRRKPVRYVLIVTHRWLSIVLGVLLAFIATTGAILVYEPEIMRALNSSAFEVSGGPSTTTMDQAVAEVTRAHPEFTPTSVTRDGDVYRVADRMISYTVDPATGHLIGRVDERPTWLGVVSNAHHCFFTCKERPAYIAALETEVPGTGWLSRDGSDLEVGGLVLGVMAVLLLYLTLTGLWLWFPRPRRWRSSMTVRWSRGRFARDTDLHKVIGVIALVPLLVWSVSGLRFELGASGKLWYALTPGVERPAPKLPKGGAQGPDIGVAAAVAAAERVVPGATAMRVNLPKKDDPEGSYRVSLRDGYDQYQHSSFPGDVRVSVGRASGAAVQTTGRPDQDLTQHIWETWAYPAHAGTFANPWWRSIWFVAGLAPLALMITGLSTWLFRRKTARRRKAARAA